MRMIFLCMALVAGTFSLYGCSTTGNTAAALEMMNNPPNSCGPGGTANVEDCDSAR